MRWNDSNTSSNEEWYLYDASGQRIVRRSQTGSGNSNTKYTLTVFGLEDHIYDRGGTSLNTKYYYSLAGHLIGVLNNNGTNFFVTLVVTILEHIYGKIPEEREDRTVVSFFPFICCCLQS